jgi:pilus assembly protein Flp/PilA
VALDLPYRCQTQPLAELKITLWGRTQMKDKLLMLSIKLRTLLSDEQGQDLIEYALIVALVAFGATAGMSTLATDINSAFSTIGTKIGTYVTS